MIKAEIVADSINPSNNRITTFLLQYPRYMHAEHLRHRTQNFCVSSSRAVPSKKIIKSILDDMEMPYYWGKNQSGMKAKEELSPTRIRLAKLVWKINGYFSCLSCWALNKIGLHKQHSNRLIEPYSNVKVLVTATDWINFFLLRDHVDSQPEFQLLAKAMKVAMSESVPAFLNPGEWHIPFSDKFDKLKILELSRKSGINEKELMIKISCAKCARTSYNNFDGKSNYEDDLKLYGRLIESDPKHLSPTEHIAMALDSPIRIGNLKGWKQWRKFIIGENPDD